MAHLENKDNYSLLNTILSYGYKIDQKKSSATWVVLKNLSKDKILYNNKKDFYINTENDKDRGDIVNFVSNRLYGVVTVDNSKEAIFEAIKKIKKTGLNGDEDIQREKYLIEKKEKLSTMAKSHLNCEPIKTYDFFIQDRFISKKTIDSPAFKNKIFNSYFNYIHSNGNNHVITNYAFGKYFNDKLVGLEIRNKTLKTIEGSDKDLFISNFDKDKPVDQIYIAESGIDILSYFELFNNKRDFYNSNAVFLSTGGNIYEDKCKALNHFFSSIKLSNTPKFINLFDNDNSGVVYDILMYVNIINQYSNSKIKLKSNKIFNTLEITDKNQKLIEKSIKDSIDSYNYSVSSPEHGSYIVMKSEENKIVLNLPKTVNIDSQILSKLFQTLKKEYSIPFSLYNHKPKHSNDWNDALVNAKKKRLNQIKEKPVKTNPYKNAKNRIKP